MSSAEIQHRLAAILSTDAVGYTRLIAEDEPAGIRAVTEARGRIAELVVKHRGRVVDSPGDNLLAEFPSALDAVRCSLEVQRALAEHAASQPHERRLLFRIGLHLGDVAVAEGRIYGDGVNVAARLQALAQPGGICVSAAVHDNVRGRLDLPFDDLGEQSLKNFPRPVRAFQLGGSANGVAPERLVEPADRPSLVVLPFVNVSGDPEQEYFADGMSEDLIGELARVPDLLVIGRGTSFAYKGRNVGARELGRALGVRHVVEGSVRRAGAHVRITARLTDAHSGAETWSERYDRELGDVFALQDEVVGGVVAELRRALGVGIWHTSRQRPVRPDVWALLVRGRAQIALNDPSAAREARELLRRCVALDPELSPAWSALAHSEAMLCFLSAEDEATLASGFEHVRRALELDPDEPDAHHVIGFLHSMRGDVEASLASSRRAVELAPGRVDLLLRNAVALVLANHNEEAISALRGLTRVDPELRYMHLFQLGLCYRRLGRIDEAIAKYRESIAANPAFMGSHMQLAAIHASLGELGHARAALAPLLQLRPDFRISRIPRVATGRDFLVENLRKLGLPE